MEHTEQTLDILADIIEELTFRESSGNRIIRPYKNRSWDDLCDDGLRLFAELKRRRIAC
jgi:hypothetical protein